VRVITRDCGCRHARGRANDRNGEVNHKDFRAEADHLKLRLPVQDAGDSRTIARNSTTCWRFIRRLIWLRSGGRIEHQSEHIPG